ncbi:D-methionine transport system permease protein metI [Bhargavaea cecembensis DSE10]|uniref:D-methionine transport system permease protein metI n=1 Tax=Bhargavaea cecembensis DSE10 TaxID=1235279 RepID=M7P9Y8_9BACL|nr:methionine ABC transporter permease [Bhargavaea cecembensis]EMR07284.1 D-methionine transport system permease protein metI [Bhargavaea cecembensis DSE10]
MLDRMDELAPLFGISLYETLVMVIVSLVIATIIGIPLGVLLVVTRPNHLYPNKWIFQLLNTIVNIIRSLPFIILMLAIIPFTELIVGTSIGIRGAIVPLIVYIAPYIARLVETAFLEVNYGIIEAYRGMGASRFQIIMRIMLREARPGILLCMTIALIGLIGATAMAGVIGAGGLGDLALRYGYQQWDLPVMFGTVIILIVLVQIIQSLGNYFAKKLKMSA